MAEIAVRVIPRARRNEIAGEREGRVLIRLTAPPVEGAANAALCRFVARCARVPARRVSVVRGQTSRDKVVRVEGIADDELRKVDDSAQGTNVTAKPLASRRIRRRRAQGTERD